jgi:gamma-glutamylaminecyclotransferase
MPTQVFVFGTLKQGFPNFATNTGQRVPGDFRTVQAYPFYLVGERYMPWLVDLPGQGQAVRGQVFEVDAQGLARMDALERIGEPDGYVRVAIAVRREAEEGDASPDGAGAREWTVQAYLKPAAQLPGVSIRLGPLGEYTPEHAALYRRRGA